MNHSPYQKKNETSAYETEVSYVDFSYHAMDDHHFFRLEAYGETKASPRWKRSRQPSNWEEFSLEYIVQGSCTYDDGVNKRVLHAGDLFILKGNAPGKLYCDKRQHLVKYYLTLRYNRIIEQIYNLSVDNFQVVSFPDPERVLMLYNDIRKLVLNGHKYLYSELTGKIYQLLFEWKNARLELEFTDDFSDILSMINMSPERFSDLKSIQDEFKLSRYTLMQLFRSKLNTTPIKYVNNLKFGKARWLLENQITPVNVISQTCGFHSVQYFIREFKKKFGKTPLQYRKTRQN